MNIPRPPPTRIPSSGPPSTACPGTPHPPGQQTGSLRPAAPAASHIRSAQASGSACSRARVATANHPAPQWSPAVRIVCCAAAAGVGESHRFYVLCILHIVRGQCSESTLQSGLQPHRREWGGKELRVFIDTSGHLIKGIVLYRVASRLCMHSSADTAYCTHRCSVALPLKMMSFHTFR